LIITITSIMMVMKLYGGQYYVRTLYEEKEVYFTF